MRTLRERLAIWICPWLVRPQADGSYWVIDSQTPTIVPVPGEAWSPTIHWRETA